MQISENFKLLFNFHVQLLNGFVCGQDVLVGAGYDSHSVGITHHAESYA